MGKVKNIKGQKFGKLTVLEHLDELRGVDSEVMK